MSNDAFWERNLLTEQQRAQADAQARNDSGTESDDNLPIASQYWDTLPSSVRVARDPGKVKLHKCIEDENQPVGDEVDETEANGAAVDETESNGAAVDETEANGTSEVRDSRTGDSSTPKKLRKATKRKATFQPFPFPEPKP